MRQKLALVLALSPLLICLNCKKCKEGENRQNIDLPADLKSSLYQFPEGTEWVFKSNLGEMDTAHLGAVAYAYSDGTCQDSKECCTKTYMETAKQNINFIVDADGLDKFNQFYSPGHVVLYAGSFTLCTTPSFGSSYKTTIVVNGVTLTDVEGRLSPGLNKGDKYPDAIYWSLSKGLVRYDYQQSDDSFISYERQNL